MRVISLTEEELERFWSKVNKTSGCWNWTGTKIITGYGRFCFRGKRQYAHRMSWVIAHGSFPEHCACHKCDNPSCVRPDHLFSATMTENILDRDRKGRQGNTKLTYKQILAIREDKRPQRIIGEEYGITQPMISRIRHRKARRLS